ncbi:MAG TPA: hypothetical protein VNN08_03090, partial [Thermoanaerobaculia bacterium]|nr:hypothetical protein [Thermoanaerobaculia bacterium]
MVLETWPAQAKRPFAQIDPGLQRAYLESLAFMMQMSRKFYLRDTVTITRTFLIAALLPILRKRDFASEPEEKVAGVIDLWIDHLEKHSGILIEQSTGVYAFFHLSIMEYLAAHGMERELGRVGALSVIADHFNESASQETCLLAVGSHAEDGDFLDAVYERVGETAVARRWEFLLLCLREEARFRPEQRETILGEYAASLLQNGRRFADLSLIGQISRFSVRHGEAVQRWITHRLDHASGDELTATAVIVMEHDPQDVSRRLVNRSDRRAAAGTLLELWPGSELGDWAAGQVDENAALSWSRRAPRDLIPVRGVAALGDLPEQLAAATLLALNERTLQSCAEGVENLARHSRQSELKFSDRIKVEPGHTIVVATPRSTNASGLLSASVSPRLARELARELARAFVADTFRTFSIDFALDSAREFGRDFARVSALDRPSNTLPFDHFLRQYAHYFRPSIGRGFDFDVHFGRDFARGFDSYFAFALANNFAQDFVLAFTDSVSVPGQSLMSSLQTCATEEDTQCAARSLLAVMAGEAWIALATIAETASDDERLGYFLF